MTVSPAELKLWNKLMVITVNSKLKVTKRVLTVKLLQKLKDRNIGTNEIEYHLKYQRMNKHWISEMRRSMLNVRLRNAQVELAKSRTIFDRQIKELSRRWGHYTTIFGHFRQIMQGEIRYFWGNGVEKNNNKVKHLCNKWKPNMKATICKDYSGGKYRGIAISDEAILESVGEKETTISAYGNIELSENEREVLKLPPKFTTFERLSKINIQAQLEAMNAKIRWELRNRERREGRPWSLEQEWEDVQAKTVYNEADGIMDFSKLRVTDAPFNRRVGVPKAMNENIETVLANLKLEATEVFEKFVDKNCDKHGNILKKNLTKGETAGIKSLKEKINNSEALVLPTDKSGKLSINSRENYINRMEPHFANDKIISWDEKEKISHLLNGHTLQLGRILKLGDKWQHWDRFKTGLRNYLCHIPVLYGCWKDHKPNTGDTGPPLRPICGATEAPNGQLSYLLSEIVTVIGAKMDEEIGTVCLSTEEMLCEMDAVNSRSDIQDLVLCSTDVEQMYPRLDIDDCAEIIANEFLQSELEVETDSEELGLYLAIIKDKKTLEELGLSDVTHKRIKSGGRNIGITTKEVIKRGKDTVSLFHKPTREPTPAEAKLMFSLALAELIKVSMKNHCYSFNGEIRIQSRGGAIGNKLTGAIATVKMLNWARIFKEKLTFATQNLQSFSLYFLKYYVDDGNICTSATPPGARLIDGKIEVIEDLIESDLEIPADQRTSKLLLEIANSICQFTSLTVDCPSLNQDGFMPILDLKVKCEDNKIVTKFFKKEMANHLVMLARSAMPPNIKRNALVQEVIRRLRNTSRDLPWELKASILSEFSRSLMLSGYPESFRLEIIRAGVIGFERACDKADNGGTPLHRPRSYRREERRRAKLTIKGSWYRPFDCVGFIPATPDSELAKAIQTVVDSNLKRLDMKGKIVETGGVSLLRQLVKTDLSGCLVPGCYFCQCDQGGASHTRSGGAYSAQCLECEKLGKSAWYDGETGDSVTERFYGDSGHLESVKNQYLGNALAKHLDIYHKDRVGDITTFTFKSEKIFRKPLDRQCHEGVMITNRKCDIKMNSKSEFHQPLCMRVVPTNQLSDNSKRPAGS